MRVAGLLLALVLVTSCFVGGTFAKYVTSDSGTDEARVAKFGVTITAKGSTFAEEYMTDDARVSTTIAKSVVSSVNKQKVVAPGTKGEMVSMTLSGTPEVAVNVKYEATVELTGWTYNDGTDDSFYCPLVITVGTDELKGTDYEDAAAFAAAVKAKIDGYSANYAANTNLGTNNKVKVPSVSWAWAFEGTTGEKYQQDDVKDTYLGNQAATATAATVSLTVKTTVTQID